MSDPKIGFFWYLLHLPFHKWAFRRTLRRFTGAATIYRLNAKQPKKRTERLSTQRARVRAIYRCCMHCTRNNANTARRAVDEDILQIGQI